MKTRVVRIDLSRFASSSALDKTIADLCSTQHSADDARLAATFIHGDQLVLIFNTD